MIATIYNVVPVQLSELKARIHDCPPIIVVEIVHYIGRTRSCDRLLASNPIPGWTRKQLEQGKMPGIRRAFVLIGVKKTSTLPELQAVWENVEDMRVWAESQGGSDETIAVITDENGDVGRDDVFDAVAEFCRLGTIDQLIVYFSGHGLVKGLSEYWLLSKACDDPGAAVNLSGSRELAQYGTIPHVVFLSDACRTPVSSLQAQPIAGGPIFPTVGVAPEVRFVDLFYGTALGAPSYEVRDAAKVAGDFRAVFTDGLLLALNGHRNEVLTRSDDGNYDAVYPVPLHKFLKRQVPEHLYDLGIRDRTQVPEAILQSQDSMCLSALPVDRDPVTSESSNAASSESSDFAEAARQEDGFAKQLVKQMLAEDRIEFIENLEVEIVRNVGRDEFRVGAIKKDKAEFVAEVNEGSSDFGPSSMPHSCGIKARGAKIVEVIASTGDAVVVDDGASVHFAGGQSAITNVLVVIESGHGVVVPVIRGFINAMTFAGDRLKQLSFIPDEESDFFFAYRERKQEIEQLRAVVAAMSRRGRFRLENGYENLARQMQIAKTIDPTLALYAAHAYRDQAERDRLMTMNRILSSTLDVTLFDVGLLATVPGEKFPGDRQAPLAPFAPLLSQTWASLQVYDYQWPPGLSEISKHTIMDSLWTVYSTDGVDLIRESINRGELS
ncbi:MAG TPA: hypothetical protein DDW52_06660 [Planctomycetaceae bacterium]|nr:hypothetical protein [Planctomycetaceae bacterium]